MKERRQETVGTTRTAAAHRCRGTPCHSRASLGRSRRWRRGVGTGCLYPLTDELIDEEWLALSYDDSRGIFELFDEIDRALAEALLTADLSDTARDDWEERLWIWVREMGNYTHHPPYSVAIEAIQRGWDFKPVQRAMHGDINDVHLWEGDPSWYAEDFDGAAERVLWFETGIHVYDVVDFVERYAISTQK